MDWIDANDLGLLIAIGVAALAIIVIIVLRARNSKIEQASTDPFASGVTANVEYQWEVRPNIFARLLVIMLIIGAAVYGWFTLPFLRGIISDSGQLWVVGIWLLSFVFGSLGQAYRYSITEDGLMRERLSSNKKNNKPELLFAWHQLSWIKPTNNGFRYYLRGSLNENLLEDGEIKFKSSKSGHVDAGENPTLVVSLIMARGVSTSAPGNSGNK